MSENPQNMTKNGGIWAVCGVAGNENAVAEANVAVTGFIVGVTEAVVAVTGFIVGVTEAVVAVTGFIEATDGPGNRYNRHGNGYNSLGNRYNEPGMSEKQKTSLRGRRTPDVAIFPICKEIAAP